MSCECLFGQLSAAAIQEGHSENAVSSLTKWAIEQLSGACFEKFIELQMPDVLCQLPSEGYLTLKKKRIHSKGLRHWRASKEDIGRDVRSLLPLLCVQAFQLSHQQTPNHRGQSP